MGNDFSNDELNHDFYIDLVGILYGLDKSYLYKLEYSLFLHTNDRDKKVKFLIPPVSGWGDHNNLSNENMFKLALMNKITYENNEYHGYHVYKSDYIDLNSCNLFNYSRDVFSYLSEHTISVNEDLSADGFIDF